MIQLNKVVLLLFIFSSRYSSLQAQNNDNPSFYPEVGKACPDFILHNIDYYKKETASLADFSGKWLVLDFLNKTCGSCVASFPRTSEMQKEFADKVQFMLVGFEDKEREIRPMFTKLKKKQNLLMPCAFDSALCNQFDIYTAPHLIIIDNNGIVRGVTSSVYPEDIKEFLAGGTPVLNRTYRFMHDTVNYDSLYGKISYDSRKPFLVDGNGASQTDFLFRSVLSIFNPMKHKVFRPSFGLDDNIVKEGRLDILGVPLLWLYNFAYFGTENPRQDFNDSTYGKYCNVPILEVADSAIFKASNRGPGRNLFSYSLIVPTTRATRKYMQTVMQRDLQNYFGFDASVEIRKCSYLRLVTIEKGKNRLRTGGGVVTTEATRASFSGRNIPVKLLLEQLSAMLDYSPTVIDESGIEGNIDVSLDCVLSDLEDVRSALRTYGLDLIKGEKEMKVLVIKDNSKTP
jgi:thiol-disulfide isomerase/thioredoxin